MDVLQIRKKLETMLPPEYFCILSKFLYGSYSKSSYDSAMQHYLQTNEAKNLHNQFLRTILFNAHFAGSAPPNVQVPPPKKIIKEETTPTKLIGMNKKNALSYAFHTYTAADMRHLPSIEQMMKRVDVILKSKKYNINVSDEAAKEIILSLRVYLTKMFSQCLRLRNSRFDLTSRNKLSLELVLFILKNEKINAGLVSPSLMAKYDPTNYIT